MRLIDQICDMLQNCEFRTLRLRQADARAPSLFLLAVYDSIRDDKLCRGEPVESVEQEIADVEEELGLQ